MNVSGLPDNIPTFSETTIEPIILQDRVYAWLVNNSNHGSEWNISRYGWGFELIRLDNAQIGKFWWNGSVWVASPFDGETKGFANAEEASNYIESFYCLPLTTS